MNKYLTVVIAVLVLCLGLGVGVGYSLVPKSSFGAAPAGLTSTLATTSTITVGPSNVSLASSTVPIFLSSGTNNACQSRIVTTYGKDVTLMFSNTMFSSTTANPTASLGHLQLASTTVTYDASIWGCAFVNAYGLGASSTLTISEFR